MYRCDVLASGSTDGTIIFWNTERSTDVRFTEKRRNMASFIMSVSPDEKYILSVLSRSVSLWDADSGQMVYELGQDAVKGSVMGATFSRTGEHFMTGFHTGRIHIWETSSGKLLSEVPDKRLDHLVSSMSEVSPDNLAAIKYRETPDGSVFVGIWDTESWTLISKVELINPSHTSFAWIAEGKYLAIGDRSVRGVRVVDPHSGKEVRGPFSEKHPCGMSRMVSRSSRWRQR